MIAAIVLLALSSDPGGRIVRCAVISDIHGNLEAFRAVLGRIRKLRVGAVVCLGDVVGYNADPNACADLVRSEGIACVLGNHDAAACGITEPDDFNPVARAAALWTREVLTAENRAFLRDLPRILRRDNMVLCHGTIEDTNRYIFMNEDARENFAVMAALPGRPQICFFGHTHVRAAYSMKNGVLAGLPQESLDLSSDTNYLVNPGGLGQPRDGDPEAPFLVYDPTKGTVSFHRVPYDIAACQRKIIDAGLPQRLAERLAMGR